MIKIAVSVEAFEAIARTLPLGSVDYEAEANERGERLIWLEAATVDRLAAMRGPGESLSGRHLAAGGSMKYPITQFKILKTVGEVDIGLLSV